MSFTKNITLSLFLLTAGLQAAAEQKSIALQMIEAMQGCITFNQQAQQPLDAAGIKQQQSAWQNSVALYHRYINDLRGQSKIARPALASLPVLQAESLMLQNNQSKALFTRLLDEYIAHLGNVYEKKSGLLGLYRNVYSIASSDNKDLSITPHEYLALVQTLDNAARQSDWSKTINITFSIMQENDSVVEKNLTLNEITAAIKQVPLPASYYATALKIAAGVAAGAAIVGGAYYAYNNPQAFGLLQGKVADVEQKLDGVSAGNQASVVTNVNPALVPTEQSTPATAPIVDSNANPGTIVPVANSSQETSLLSKMGNDAWEGMFGSKSLAPEYWQAGGDAELYGAPGLSGKEASSTGISYLGGAALKSGATAIGTRLGLTGPSTGELAGQGAIKGIENFGKYGSSSTGAIAAKTIESSPTASNLAQARIGEQIGNYVQPVLEKATTKTIIEGAKEGFKDVSPTWAVNFGQ